MSANLYGGLKCLKYLMFIFNFIFFVIGGVLLGFGIYVKVGKSDYVDVADDLTTLSEYVTVGNLLIVVGVIIFIVAFLGCCGAISENKHMLFAFFFFMSCIFLLELASGIYGIVEREDIEDQMEKDFLNAIEKKYKNDTETSVINKAIDKFQKDFECCGYNDWRDWKDSVYFSQEDTVPKSCCKSQQNCLPQSPDLYDQKGCFKEVMEFFRDNAIIVGVLAIMFAAIQIFGLVISLWLFCAIKKSEGVA